MQMLRGDVFQCPQCLMTVKVMQETKANPAQLVVPRCCCGEPLILVQSGSESNANAPTNNTKMVGMSST